MTNKDARVDGIDDVTDAQDAAKTIDAAQRALAETMAETDAARAEAQTNLDGWQRARAEFTNYKRRTEKEMSEAYHRAAADVLKSLLPVIDDFELAEANVSEDLKANAWVAGTLAIRRKFDRILEQYEVTPVGAVGDLFDPALHEAIGEDDSPEMNSGQITAVLRRGYAAGDRVLRPAMVRVAR